MKRFRVLSDLHVDINSDFPLDIKDKETFTVICGDMAGETEEGMKWIDNNIKQGLLVSGNHLPYNYSMLTIQQLRDKIAQKYQIGGSISYLDAECGAFKKIVDGIMFIGTCMYSDMKISTYENISGDENTNKIIAKRSMNDYRYGVVKFAEDGIGRTMISPNDYQQWFQHAYELFEEELNRNENSKDPLPVVLITHFPLIKKMLEHSGYVDDDNYASYGSDFESWIASHPSIKCYCCGHAHDVSKEYRVFKINHEDGSHCLVVNNARGYVSRLHDQLFNPNRFVNTQTWEIEEDEEDEETKKRKKDQLRRYMAYSSIFI